MPWQTVSDLSFETNNYYILILLYTSEFMKQCKKAMEQ